MIHLDANALIGMGIEGSARWRQVSAWLRDGELLGASTVAWSEFLCGPLLPSEREWARQVTGRPVPLIEADAKLAAELYNLGGRRRGSLSDCQIAAIAIRSKAALATADRAGFVRFAAAGLRLA